MFLLKWNPEDPIIPIFRGFWSCFFQTKRLLETDISGLERMDVCDDKKGSGSAV
jgi:hypothetical protein